MDLLITYLWTIYLICGLAAYPLFIFIFLPQGGCDLVGRVVVLQSEDHRFGSRLLCAAC